MNKSTEILMAARDNIKDDRNWTRGCLARDDRGENTSEIYNGVSFCAVGSLFYVLQKNEHSLPLKMRNNVSHECKMLLMEALNNLSEFESVSRFNDSKDTTHTDVIGLYTEAIRLSMLD